jgi:hypothetical protein
MIAGPMERGAPGQRRRLVAPPLDRDREENLVGSCGYEDDGEKKVLFFCVCFR